jgi:hypothetical protein
VQREAQRQRELEAALRREQAEAKARRQYTEDHRRAAIARRIGEVQFAYDARAYSAALLAAADQLDQPRAEQVRAWARLNRSDHPRTALLLSFVERWIKPMSAPTAGLVDPIPQRLRVLLGLETAVETINGVPI